MPSTIGIVASHYTPPFIITANKTSLYVDDDITFTITPQATTTTLPSIYCGLIGYDTAKNRTMPLFDDGLLNQSIVLNPFPNDTILTKRLDPRTGIFDHWIGWDVGMFLSRDNVQWFNENNITVLAKTPTLATIYPPSFESTPFGTYTLDSPRSSNRTTNITIPSVSLNPLRSRLIKCALSWGTGPNFTRGGASIVTYDASSNITSVTGLDTGITGNNYMRLPANTATITYSVSLGSAFGGQHAEGTVTLYAETDASYNLRVANAL
jgi:hypothetical protein